MAIENQWKQYFQDLTNIFYISAWLNIGETNVLENISCKDIEIDKIYASQCILCPFKEQVQQHQQKGENCLKYIYG